MPSLSGQSDTGELEKQFTSRLFSADMKFRQPSRGDTLALAGLIEKLEKTALVKSPENRAAFDKAQSAIYAAIKKRRAELLEERKALLERPAPDFAGDDDGLFFDLILNRNDLERFAFFTVSGDLAPPVYYFLYYITLHGERHFPPLVRQRALMALITAHKNSLGRNTFMPPDLRAYYENFLETGNIEIALPPGAGPGEYAARLAEAALFFDENADTSGAAKAAEILFKALPDCAGFLYHFPLRVSASIPPQARRYYIQRWYDLCFLSISVVNFLSNKSRQLGGNGARHNIINLRGGEKRR
jgi:hypothetical protein